jgi:hypothetical protein
MKCVGEAELVRAEMGELTLNRVREVDAHVAGCSRCAQVRSELRELVSDLGRRPAPADGERFTEQVMAARSSQPAPARPRRFGIPVFAAAAVMVLAVGAVTLSTSLRGKDEAWTARGQAGDARSRTPSAEVLVVRDGKLLPVSGQTLSSTDAFAVRTVNRMREPRYLAAFAVDAAGAVHWIFPEYTDGSLDPKSIPLAPNEDEQLLPQLVAPDKPSSGPMRVFTLISRESTSVKQIEKALQSAATGMPSGRALARAYPGSIIREWSCTWAVR